MHVYLPKKLDLDALLADCPPDFKYDVDNIKYLIGTIIKLKSTYKDYQDQEYVPLQAELLQRKVRNYNTVLKYLVENGIIETDNYFIFGEKCRGYKLADKYIKDNYSTVEIKKNSLVKQHLAEERERKHSLRNYNYLTKWFNADLQIDYAGAIQELQRQFKNDEGTLAEKARKFHARKLTLDMLKDSVYNLSVDENVMRFHSVLTNIKSELRNYITYAGQQLVSVDISNSQPFTTLMLFNPEFYEKNSEFNIYKLSPTKYNTLKPQIPYILSILSSINYITLVKTDVSQCGSDLELYCTLVDKGQLYEYIGQKYNDKTGIVYDINIPEDKRKLKDVMFSTLFSDNSFLKQPGAEMKLLFSKLFPTVYDIFATIKKGGNKVLLPTILQHIESDLVIRRVARNIGKEKPSLPIFTIHDSISTIEGQEKYVRSRIKETFSSIFNYKPTLRIEQWKPK